MVSRGARDCKRAAPASSRRPINVPNGRRWEVKIFRLGHIILGLHEKNRPEVSHALLVPDDSGFEFAQDAEATQDRIMVGSVPAESTTVLSWRTTRKPRLLFRFSGEFLLRFADRQFTGALFQLPPRFTRFEPY